MSPIQEELRARAGHGRNLAALIEPANVATDINAALSALVKQGVGVLAEAKGAIGVLRAMSSRLGELGMYRAEEIANTPGDWQLLHACFIDGETALHDIRFRLNAAQQKGE